MSGTRWQRSLDLGTRTFWRLTGREVDLDRSHAWLSAPMGETGAVGDSWLESEADRRGGELVRDVADAGLLPDWNGLAGPGFDPGAVHPLIQDFYRRTAAWSMEVWTGWAPWAWPMGELVSRLFAKRVRQLALPMRSIDTSRGMDSQVSVITDGSGAQVSAGWVRTLRLSGDIVFSGCYGTASLPGSTRPSVHVAFPLESGNLQVFLRPENRPGGGIELVSAPGAWGQDGAYVVVDHGGRRFARRVPIHEPFRLFVDDDGVLRTDQELRLWRTMAVRPHYKMARQT